jgi:hypothetical protein
MAVGRITGPLLAKNLTRDGIDLSFETDLLYLDVTNGRIGIKTDTPGYTLDVNGDTNILALRVVTTSTLGNLTISSTSASTTLSNSLGDVVIQAPTEQRVRIQNDTVVTGDIHATGNITADGSVQLGNLTGTDTLSIYADIVSNVTPQTSGQYNLGAPDKEWAKGYIDSLVASALVGKEGQDLEISTDKDNILNIRGRVRIWDENPLGTGVVTANTLYVSMDGSDTNDGGAPGPTRACRTITGALRSPFYKANTSIKVAPGRYLEDNPLVLKPYTSVIGSDLRTTVIEPINKTQDLFWLDSGNYLAQMLFVNGQSGLLPGTGYTPGTNRGAYATAFRPNYGGPKIDLYHSPYVQNCSNQSGPWLQDGTMFNPNQTVQVPEAVGTATWIINTTTLTVHLEEGALEVGQTINPGPTKTGYFDARTLLLANKAFFQEQVISYIDSKYEYFDYDEDKCIRDTGLIIDSLIVDLVFSDNGYTQSNFAGLQYWNQTSTDDIIPGELTTTTAAINFVSALSQEIVRNITTGTRFSSTATQTTGTAATITEANAVAADFTVITNILTTGTAGVSDIIIPNGISAVSANAQNAATLLQANRTYIQEQAVAFVEATKTPGFVYDPVKCYRDVGYMVDSVTFDILYGGNRQAVMSGVYYYGFSETASAIPNERPQTSAAFYRIKEIVGQIITNQLINKAVGNISSQVINLPAGTAAEAVDLEAMIDLITQIINAGPDAALEQEPVSLNRSTNVNVLRAAAVLQANKSFITSEVINFIEQTYNNGFTYNQPKCFRDTGLIVDSIAVDLLYQGTTESAFAGLQYWNQDSYVGTIKTEYTATIQAINYVSELAQKIVQNQTTGIRYQSTVTQTTSTSVGTINEAVFLADEFGIITNILSNGTQGVTDIIVPNGVASAAPAIVNSANLLQANKTYIQAETIAYINSVYKIFDTADCARDTGLIIDAIATDLLFSTSSNSTFAGLQYWNQTSTEDVIPGELTTTTNAINYIKSIAQQVVQGITITVPYSTGTQITALPLGTFAEATIIGTDFDVITTILTTGTAGVSDIIIPNGYSPSPTGTVQNAYALLQANRTFLQQEAVAYVEATKTVGFTYDQADCYRDIGYIIDAVSFDLLYGGNRQAVQSGVVYYGFNAQESAIIGEIENTLEAYSKLREIIEFVIKGISIPVVGQTNVVQTVTSNTGTAAEVTIAQGKLDLITNIVQNGPTGVVITPVSLTASTSTDVVEAVTLLAANRAFIVAEVLEFISNPTDFVYDQATCYRDVGYILDSVTFDLVHGGNRQAVTSGVYYYDFNENATAIPGEIAQTTAAYNHIRNLVDDILTNTPITPTTGNTATQVFLSSTATSVEINLAFQKLDLITDIILNGPDEAPVQQPISLVASTSTTIQTAYNLLLANREFIQNEVIAYTNVFDVGFVYNRAKCRRDIGIVVENIAYDIAFGGNEKSRESGLAYWDGVTSVISNEITETADAFEYLADLAKDVITNTTATNLLNDFQTAPQVINTVLNGGGVAVGLVDKLIGIINNIIVNGPSVAPIMQVGNGPDWGSVSAQVLLESNRQFIQNEVIAWTNQTYPDLIYREDKCYRDTGLIIDAITQDIILNANAKTIEAAVSYYAKGNNILLNAEYGDRRQLVETVAAINRAKEISLQIINNTTVTTTSFVFNPTKCARDTGLIIDGLAQDLLFNGSSQSTFAGIQYWNHDNYVGDIAGQLNTTTAAINHISLLAQEVIRNITTGTTRYQSTVTQDISLQPGTVTEAAIIAKNFSTVTNILNNGVIGVTDAIIPNNFTRSGNVNVQRAFNLLQANKEYLKAEAIAFIESTKNFRYDPVDCFRDTGLIVDSIALDLAYPTSSLSQATFAGLQYWNQGASLFPSELTTITNTISYVNDLVQRVIQNNTGGLRYQASVVQFVNTQSATLDEVAILDDEFNLVIDILNTGTAGVTDIIVPNGIVPSTSVNINRAYILLTANKSYIQAEAIAYVETTKTPGFVYDQDLYARDIGFLIDSISFDLLHGGNKQAIQSAVYYYSFNGSSTAIPGEIAQTIAAFEFVKSLSTRLVRNVEVTPLQTDVAQDLSLPAADGSVTDLVEAPVRRIIKIIENGPTAVANKRPISLTANSNVDARKAAAILLANREFIQSETIAFIEAYLTFQYDQEKCARDVGYILDSVSFDLLYGGNRQSIQAGVYYWGYSNVSTSLPKEQQASTAAYQFMKSLISNVVRGVSTSTLYQNTLTQVVSVSTATQVEVEQISRNIDKITTIINVGPQAAEPARPIALTEVNNQFVRNAVNLLAANRAFIVAETIGFVDEIIGSNDQIFLPFYDMGANATLAVIRNFDIITNILQNGPGVVPIISDGNGVFVKTGLSPDDILTAPVVTAITTVSTNVYQIEISQSTVGFGDAQSLYFGQTAVFPLFDRDVPDRWQQRRINPLGSMGGSLVDGGVISDRSPINSFVYDAYTQINQGGEGIRITNNGYAQLVSVFTIFCSRAVVVENGGIASVTNSNSNFGETCLTAKGYGRRSFSGYIKNPPVLPFFPNGVYPQAAQVEVYIADPDLRPHISLVMEVEPPEGYINNQGLPGFLGGATTIDVLSTGTIEITGIDNTSMVIGQKFYIIDQFGRSVDSNNQPYLREGTIVADVGYQSVTLNFPLNSGGGELGNTSFFNLFTSGNAYYTVLSSQLNPDPIPEGTSLLPNQQNIQEADSLTYINTLSQFIVSNTAVPSPLTTSTQIFDASLVGGAGANAFIASRLNIISNILRNGPDSAPEIQRGGDQLQNQRPAGADSAASLLRKNKSFIQNEVVQYVDDTFFGFDYDQVKCARDTRLIVDAIAQDLLFNGFSQTTFAGLQYWDQNTNTNAIILGEITTTTNAINYVKGISQQIIQGVAISGYTTATQITNLPLATPAEAGIIGTDFDVILNILNSGTQGVTDIIVPNGITPINNINTVRAYNLLQANKTFIQTEAIGFVESTKTPGFVYDQDKCFRDVGYIVDSVSIDLLYGGNRQSVQAGVYYYGYDSTSTAIVGEIPQTVDAYNKIAELSEKLILGQEIVPEQSLIPQVSVGLSLATTAEVGKIDALVANLVSIIAKGPEATITNTPLPTAESDDEDAVNAALLVDANREFIVAETVAYVNQTFPGFVYDSVKCARDTGLIVDAIAQDLLFESYSQSIFAGVQYWNQDANTNNVLFGEITTTTNAVTFVKSLSQRIVTNDTGGVRYQSIKRQTTNLPAGTTSESASLGADFDVILNILNTGTTGISDIIVPNGITKSGNLNVQRAFAVLLANKEYIQAEAIAFVEATKTPGFTYNQDKCFRDVGYIIDAVAVDLLYGGNRQSVQAGAYYYGYNQTSTAVPGEITQTVAAYEYIKLLLDDIIQGNTVAAPKQILVPQVTSGTPGSAVQVSYADTRIDIITSIIVNGPVVMKMPLSVIRSTDPDVIAAATMLNANREFITAETIAYINNKYLNYDRVKCRRDVGFIVDALIFDLEKGGNYNAVIAGKSYYATPGTRHLTQLEESVSDPGLFPDGAICTFYQRSYMSASGYLFEYVGAGTNYASLPQRGRRDPDQTKEVVQLNNGKVFFTSTDQNGDFRIGTGLVISQATGVLSGRTFTKSLFANLTPFILAIEG